MRRLTKLLCLAALVFGIIGGAFCVAGFCLGFDSGDLARMIRSGKYYFQDNLMSAEDDFSELTPDDIEFEQNYGEIRELDVDVSVAELRLVPGQEWKVTGYALPSGFHCEKSGAKLRIRAGSHNFTLWNFRPQRSYLVLTFPENASLDEMEIDCGTGSVEMEAGMLACRETNIDCGIGSCTLRMDAQEELKVRCGVGDITLLLRGAQEDFDYKLDCGVGDAVINGASCSQDPEASGERHYEGSVKQEIDHGAGREIKVSCGVGSVKIDFEPDSRQPR